MDILTWVIAPVTILILLTLYALKRHLFVVKQHLSEIEGRLRDPFDDRVHDTLHPVFSLRQLRLARQRFEDSYRTQLRLERELYGGQEWAHNVQDRSPANLSPYLHEQMRQVCEALVEAECAWKEYAFMVDGNLSVANRGRLSEQVVKAFNALMTETRGTPKDVIGGNDVKLGRVNTWFDDWVARLGQARQESIADFKDWLAQPRATTPTDWLFKEAWEDRNEWTRPL